MFPDQSAPNLLQGLNPEQLSAVTWPPQSALVLAGAGSGKTRVLTTRIAWLLQTGQASVHSIMAVTFTNKAAKEMQTRLGAMIPINVRAMWLGTFHGLCHRFLRLHHRDAGLPSSFQILDSGDQLSLIKRLLKTLNIAEEIIAPRSLQGFINAQKESGLRASVLSAPDPECYAEYDKICQREGVVDFAELMLRSYEMLQSNEILRQHYQNRFNHILVDEFQDTNKLQYAWLKLMAGGNAAVFAVGDDDQSIYRFRGAHVGNMTALMEEFHIDAPVKLEQNYRSVGNILAAANAVIENNDERLGKNLRTDAEAGDKIRYYSAFTDRGRNQSPRTRRLGFGRNCRPLPQQRPIARYRTKPVPQRHSLQNLRWAALLRTPRNQTRARLPAPRRQSRRRQRPLARHQLPAARHRRTHHRKPSDGLKRTRHHPLAGSLQQKPPKSPPSSA